MDFLEEISPGSGQYKCAAGSECKVGGAGGGAICPPAGGQMQMMQMQQMPMMGGGASDVSVTCYVHGKSRKANVCTQVSTQSGIMWECTPATRCKGAAVAAQPRFTPYARPAQPQVMGAMPGAMGMGYAGAQMMGGQMMGMMGGGYANQPGGDGSLLCVVHNKKRKDTFLQQISPGVYRCKGDSLCKGAEGGAAVTTAPETATCAIHGRNRLTSFLQFEENTGTYSCKPSNECKLAGTKPI